MGVTRMTSTIRRHPATKNALSTVIPKIEVIYVDQNGNIHFVVQKTITELNEIMYYVFKKDNHEPISMDQLSIEVQGNSVESTNMYGSNMTYTKEELDELLERYQEDYSIGNTYAEIHSNLSNESFVIELLFREVILYTTRLICSVNTGYLRKAYLAVDGVPSMAKMKEQMNRRFVGGHMHNLKQEIITKYKIGSNKIFQLDLFYFRSMICAGTPFMERIQQALFHLKVGTNDDPIEVEVSTVEIKGEGEKKIIHAIEETIADSNQNYGSYCIMSPDSDMLILIGLLLKKEQTKTLLAEKKFYTFRIDYQRKNEYQFFDLNLLLENLTQYYAKKCDIEVSTEKMLDVLFMLVVFGNDFLPKLEPLDITQHFDLVVETCLKQGLAGYDFITNGQLNYDYLLTFFKTLNTLVLNISAEQHLDNTYTNYFKLCKQLTIGEEAVTYHNLSAKLNIIKNCFSHLTDYVIKYPIDDIRAFYENEVCVDPDYVYAVNVFPKICRFDGSHDHGTEGRGLSSSDPFLFFKSMCKYLQTNRSSRGIQLRIKLMSRDFNHAQQPGHFNRSQGKITDYMAELERLEKTMEPYRTMFKMQPINLCKVNLFNGGIQDMRQDYYKTYVKASITSTEIESMTESYLCGIEWLFQYYIKGARFEWNGWSYEGTQPPLIDDIIAYLEKHPSCRSEFATINAKLNALVLAYPENTRSPLENYLYVTPNDYTNAGVSPSIADVLPFLTGYGAIYGNKCQIDWQAYHAHCVTKKVASTKKSTSPSVKSLDLVIDGSKKKSESPPMRSLEA